jgi:flagellin
MIGMGIAEVVEKLRKVPFGCADEGNGKRGSFHKVTRGSDWGVLSGQAPAAGTHWINSTGTRRNCMSLGVLNNISAINAQNNLANTQASLSKTLQQLSSGSRINSGADDAAGLSLANGLQASSTALSQSAKNASEGVDFLQVADGALAQVTSLLNRAITLATEASNGTLNSSQVTAADSEYQKILTEIDTINTNTEYNGINTFATHAAFSVADPANAITIGTGAVTDDIKVTYADGSFQKITNSNGTNAGDTVLKAGATLSDLAKAINAGSGTSVASVQNNQLILTGGAKLSAGSVSSLTDAVSVAAKSSTIKLGSASDTFTTTASSLNVTYNGTTTAVATTAGMTAAAFVTAINAAGTTSGATSPVATLSGNTISMATGSTIAGSFSETAAAPNAATNASVAIFTSDGTISQSYNNLASDMVDASTSALALAGSKLTDTISAQAALKGINQAITSVAGSRGTIGANINTLTAVGNVMTTQSTNTLAAMNDVTATDYGQATSDMSKFQILSQTGIAALSQANQAQQLITKLLQ